MSHLLTNQTTNPPSLASNDGDGRENGGGRGQGRGRGRGRGTNSSVVQFISTPYGWVPVSNFSQQLQWPANQWSQQPCPYSSNPGADILGQHPRFPSQLHPRFPLFPLVIPNTPQVAFRIRSAILLHISFALFLTCHAPLASTSSKTFSHISCQFISNKHHHLILGSIVQFLLLFLQAHSKSKTNN